MNEDKTKDTQPAQEPPRRTLRSSWAQLQCRIVLAQHRLRHWAHGQRGALSGLLAANPAFLWLGAQLYALGFATEYVFVRFGRFVKRHALHAARTAREFCILLVVTAFPGAEQVLKDLFGPIVLFVRGIGRMFVRARTARKQEGLGAALLGSVRFVANGIAHNLVLLPRMAMYVLPLCALAVLWTVVHDTLGRPYALAVQVNGETVGYVASEDVFNSAREDVQERINYAGEDRAQWSVEPTYTLAVSGDLLDENDMANAILRASSDEISEGWALYLDGELTAVCADGAALQSYLSSLLEPYEDPEDTSITVGFNKTVSVEQGIYFNESFQSYDEIVAMLTSVQQAERIYTVVAGDTISGIASQNGLTMRELCALNTGFTENGENGLTIDSKILPGDELIVTREESLLEVRITKVETTEEEIPYATETTKSSEYTVGTRKVTQEGVNGLRRVTTQTVYDTNGMALEQTILNTEVIKEAVNEQVVVGSKKVTAGTAYITGSGQFIWPVPGYRYCSRWFGGSHKGVDICASAGTPIYASAAGTVSKAGYEKSGAGSGYGYSVIISHSGGYSTVYAHCLSLTVSAGQTVKQGQLIGYVGSTGRSTGNHCHFEIRLNGTKLSVQNFFPSYYK